jgi:hypothetical protein
MKSSLQEVFGEFNQFRNWLWSVMGFNVLVWYQDQKLQLLLGDQQKEFQGCTLSTEKLGRHMFPICPLCLFKDECHCWFPGPCLHCNASIAWRWDVLKTCHSCSTNFLEWRCASSCEWKTASHLRLLTPRVDCCFLKFHNRGSFIWTCWMPRREWGQALLVLCFWVCVDNVLQGQSLEVMVHSYPHKLVDHLC